MPLTTVTSCKAFRGIPSDNTEHDAELERLIPAVQSFLELECGRLFEQATVTEYFSGEEFRDRLIVARPPIVSVTNLWDDVLRAYTTPLSSTDYVVVDADAGFIRLDHLLFQRGIRNIKLTYVGGYTTIPKNLEQAAIELVWGAHEKGLHNLIGVRSKSVGDGSVQYVNLDWPMNLEPILAQYRLHQGVA